MENALTSIIKEEIAKWHAFPWWPTDPMDPEFDGEAKSIAKQLGRIHSERDAALCLSRVFTSSFQACPQFSPEACLEPGRSLYIRLVAERLIF